MKIAPSLRHIIFSSLACSALPYFSTLSHNRHDFWGKKFIEDKMVASISSTIYFSVTFMILTRIQRHMIIKVHMSPHSVPVILDIF